MEQRLTSYAIHGIPGFDLFVDNCHMNPRGHRIVALEVARFFRTQYLVPEEGTSRSRPIANGPAPAWSLAQPSTDLFQSDRFFENQRFFDSSVRVLETAVASDPTSQVNPMVLGMLYADAGRTEDALALFDRALSVLANNEHSGIDENEHLQPPLTALLQEKRFVLTDTPPPVPQ
jgi:tetratricopeptide (TPR) repeat protein